MKKAFSLFLIFTLLLALTSATGCNTQSIDNKPAASKPTYNTPLEQLTTYDTDAFKTYWIGQGFRYIPEDIRNERTLFKLSLQFPVERIVSLSETTIAVIYRLEHYDHVSYAYVIFNAPANQFFAKNYLNWSNDTWEVYFVSKILSSSDYSSLAVGDHISKAVAIDVSLACSFREYIDTSSGQWLGDNVFETYKSILLSDGVLCITFLAPFAGIHDIADDDRAVITSINFYPYGSTDAPDYISVINYPNIFQED